ncbi:MAG: permease, partial [Chlorobium limicola]|nr:permease [Chlorobium limicola]
TSGCCCSHKEPEPEGLAPKFINGMRFAFGDLLKDIGGWLFFGVLLAGVISVFLSPEIVSRYLSNEYLSMLLMLAISVPLYVCATASTPIAAALALKGISPGAALVFLLAGPATNAAAITVIAKLIGRRATVVYVAVIVAMSFLAGIAVNALYGALGIDITGWLAASAHEEGGLVAMLSAVALILLVVRAMLPAKAHAH